MCGIAGILRFDKGPVSADSVKLMTDSMTHRGPDGEGIYLKQNIGLGHRRLSIIDLEGGKQPLSNEDETIWITFNGEIYNYRDLKHRLTGLGHTFRTSSDTEVIVHAYEQWGVECLQQLRGMFAFAIWDENRQELFLARDRFGIKPLNYAITNSGFYFSSELNSLMTHKVISRSIDVSSIDLYLHFQYIPAPKTIYQDVKKLLPAHYIIVKSNGTVSQPQRYWQASFAPEYSLDENQWIKRLDEALHETVNAHLVSDVPFGAFLSGGIDSSTVVAYMSQILKEPVEAFCIGHPQQDYDERIWAEEAARICHASFHTEVISDQGLDTVPALVRHMGEPFADSSILPTNNVAQFARKHVKMVLSGDGGDELFAGYHAYYSILNQFKSDTNPIKAWKHKSANLARRIGLWPKIETPVDAKYKRTAVIQEADRKCLWKEEFHELLNNTRFIFNQGFMRCKQSELLNHLQAYDIENYVPYDNLFKVDTTSMLNSLEVRTPFLDHIFLETVARIPPEMKMQIQGEGKYSHKDILKKTVSKFFSHEFLHRPKKGFEIPLVHWFSGKTKEELRDKFCGHNSTLTEYFKLEYMDSLVLQADTSKVTAWKVWSLLILQEWITGNTNT